MSQTNTHKHKKGLSLAFWLNLIFSIIELTGGILTNSSAIIADAFHDFTDAMAIGAAVLLEKISGRKRSPKFSYGYKRFSLLSAFGMSLFLLTGAILMCFTAYRSFLSPEVVDSQGMLWLAILGIAVNGFAFLRIKKTTGDSHHEHTNHVHAHHGHSHSHDIDFNSRAIMLHLLEDVLGWVAVLIGALVISFTGWYWVDGFLALAIAAFIGYNATKNLISTLRVFMQSVPQNIDSEQLSKDLLEINGIESIHDLHIWTLDGNYNISSLHAVVNSSAKNREEDIISSVSQLMTKYKIQHSTIQIETVNSNCNLSNC